MRAAEQVFGLHKEGRTPPSPYIFIVLIALVSCVGLINFTLRLSESISTYIYTCDIVITVSPQALFSTSKNFLSSSCPAFTLSSNVSAIGVTNLFVSSCPALSYTVSSII